MRDKFAKQLLDATHKLDELSANEVQILLRRAALRIDNRTHEAGKTILIPEAMELVDDFAREHSMSRDEATNAILIDWGVSAGRIEIDDLSDDED
ncbi:hypothetical protein R2G56_08750 [Nitratireductor aquimarinus]|uniref:Ribbon-helix-helix protein, copG family n=1 Tax=Nitratireductor aquimarinus TaxID=889300 RepID=A0ABU4AJR0_9HYPH|nr:hypothetical protein [Nitratireductor aquimarinus]MDV2967828.1 hypothetical protein [Nitratireductor aquimarinus]MDV6226371.1 hypothetical protein [Nitratireductor aquimarinus]